MTDEEPQADDVEGPDGEVLLVSEVLAVEGEVLVTRWIDGTPLSRVIASGSQDDRDRCGIALVRLFTSGPARARRLHGDPHPGNFRLMDDGRLGVLDFGSNQPMPHGWPPRLGPPLAAGRTATPRNCTASPPRPTCCDRTT